MQRSFFWLIFGTLLAFTFSTTAAFSTEAGQLDANITQSSFAFAPVSILAQSHTSSVDGSSSSLWQQLNLTPLQKRQIQQISRRYRQQISQLKQDLQVAQAQLAKMMIGTETTEVIRAKHQYISQLRQQLGTLHFESMLATREVLNPQQRQKFAEIVQTEP